MTSHIKPTEGVLPTPEQILLLKSGFCDKDIALDAWHNWCARIDKNIKERGAKQLMPFVYKNLLPHLPGDKYIKIAGNVYEETKKRNTESFSKMFTILSILQNQNIPTIVLKGSALTVLYYKDLGLRSMLDFDVWVPPDHFKEVCKILLEEQWKPLKQHPNNFNTRFGHAINFYDKELHSIDLHCHILQWDTLGKTDSLFTENTITTEMMGFNIRTPNPTDLFFHTCIHGLIWVEIPTVKWIADAMIQLRDKNPQIDWDRIIHLSNLLNTNTQIHTATSFLRDTFDLNIPDESFFRNGLSKEPRLKKFVANTIMTTRKKHPIKALVCRLIFLGNHLQASSKSQWIAVTADYLKHWLQVNSTNQIPRAVARKIYYLFIRSSSIRKTNEIEDKILNQQTNISLLNEMPKK